MGYENLDLPNGNGNYVTESLLKAIPVSTDVSYEEHRTYNRRAKTRLVDFNASFDQKIKYVGHLIID
jgi:hypothetical protein